MKRLTITALAAALAAAALAIAGGGALAATAPTATTTGVKEVTATSATLTGTVDPNGQATTYAFQYGQSTTYPYETAPQSAGSGSTAQAVTATVTGLRPGTRYHFRLIATAAGSSVAGSDFTFNTTGIAPPSGLLPTVATNPATIADAHDATLNGTVGPSTVPVRAYFEVGTGIPYEFRTIPQVLPPSTAPRTVSAPLSGLAGARSYHYRLLAEGEGGELTAGIDASFDTTAVSRLSPRGLVVLASPPFQRRLPVLVTVSGQLLLPSGVSRRRGCEGYVTITFRRVHEVAIQVLRAGLHRDCTYLLPVRFSSARRLHGGRITVEVVFPGNQVLHRFTASKVHIQIG
jgi:hypothetical protein